MKLLTTLLLLAVCSCNLATKTYPPHVVEAYQSTPVMYLHSLTEEGERRRELYLDKVYTYTLTGAFAPPLPHKVDVPPDLALDLLERLLWNTKEPFDVVLVEVGPEYAGDWYVSQVTGEVSRFTVVDIRATAYRGNYSRAEADGVDLAFVNAPTAAP